MNQTFRIFIVAALLLGVLLVAGSQTAWAQPKAEEALSSQAQAGSFASLSHKDGGTVKPPPDKVKICKNGNFSVGGVSTLRVRKLARDYCIIASLHDARQLRGSLPDGARILADATLFRVTYRGHFVGQLPSEAGNAELCYAVPPGKNATIYLLNQGKHTWQPIPTTVKKGTACARVQTSGYYALIGK
jgi:hypothetical protein